MLDLFAGDCTEQFRMVRFQLFNWGTFSGLHDIPIAKEGHLFIGGSGSGKSTLLDAMSVLLTPGQINFNAAAREGERKSDRTLVSYMRGAWTTRQDDDGRSALQYLRGQSTWSALALTYENANRTVTLLFVGTLRGSTNEDSKVTRRYYVIDSAFDIERLSDFSKRGYDWGFIKKVIPEAAAFNRFAPYCECFRRKFGIEEETVLKLLHKAQSARNLGELNQFLRKFMLDEPETFKVADLLVGEFTSLYEAHESVVKARDQVKILEEAREYFDRYEKTKAQIEHIKVLQDQVSTWGLDRRIALIDGELPMAQEAFNLRNARYDEAQRHYDKQNETLERLNFEYLQKGGDRLGSLNLEILSTREKLSSVSVNRDRLVRQLQVLGLSVPETREIFDELGKELKNRVESLAADQRAMRSDRDELLREEVNLSAEFKTLCETIEEMQKTPSNIPFDLLQMRSRLADLLGVPIEQLPFAGELMQVKDTEKAWQGAIERVLHNFATSILVPEGLYKRFSQVVDETHLGARLVYHRVKNGETFASRSLDEKALPLKLDLKAGVFEKWLKNELHFRFDYLCVEDGRAMADAERAVTLAGQVKHNRTRHEKDDRRRIDDRRFWVLGFSNADKLALFKENAASLAQKLSENTRDRHRFDDELNALSDKIQAAKRGLEYAWDEVDLKTVASQLKQLQDELQALQTRNRTLDELAQSIHNAKARLKEFDIAKQKAFSDVEKAKTHLEELESERLAALSLLKAETVNAECLLELTARSGKFTHALTLKNLSTVAEKLVSALAREMAEQSESASADAAKTSERFAFFKAKWPESLATLDTRLESASEFFEELDNLRREGLPNYEKKFKDLLHTQARQNLVDLYSTIDTERRRIKERVAEVNKSLARVPFNRLDGKESHLRIAITDKHLPEVREFQKMHQSIITTELSEMSNETAERYFDEINALVQRLNPHATDMQALRWREKVLDVRLHMDFNGVEFEENEGKERIVEVYQSGAGKSGGQRQKLTVICLAAALRYQLGGKESDYPSYAPVILDEAFDKADTEFTDIALTIFKDFHFQLIIATPEKSVATFDPYVGGTSFVSCKNRNASSVLAVIYDAKTAQFEKRTQP